MRKIINKALGRTEESTEVISKEDLSKIRSLNGNYKNIKDLNGIEYCANLNSLYLSHNKIINLSPIQGLTKLVELDLGYNEIENINPVANLQQLILLYLNNNHIKTEDLSKLNNLTKLRFKNYKNQIII